MLPIIIAVMAMVFHFMNGYHDSSNIVAIMISSRALSHRKALGVTEVAKFAGPFLCGVAVATSIGSEIADPSAIRSAVSMYALGMPTGLLGEHYTGGEFNHHGCRLSRSWFEIALDRSP